MLRLKVYIAPTLKTSLSHDSLDELSSLLVAEVKEVTKTFGTEAKEVSLTAIHAACVSVGAAEVQIELSGEVGNSHRQATISRYLIEVTKEFLRAYPRVSVSCLVIPQRDTCFRISQD